MITTQVVWMVKVLMGSRYPLENSGGAGGVDGCDEASDDHDASGVGGNGVGGLLYPLENSGVAGGSGGVGVVMKAARVLVLVVTQFAQLTNCSIPNLSTSKPPKPMMRNSSPSWMPSQMEMSFRLPIRDSKRASLRQPTVLRQLHDNGGHLGVHKTLDKVKERYYWPGYGQDVKTWTRECEQCQQRNSPQPQPQAPLGTIKATKPFEKVSWDIMGPLLPSESGNKYILVVTDLFTKSVAAFPIHDTTSSTLATVLVDQFISRYGVPVVLHSDQGANLCSEVIKTICKLLGMDQTRTSAYHPQGNGQVERFNRTLEAMLAKNVKDNQRDWDQWLQKVLFAYRTSLHETTGFWKNSELTR